MTSKYGVNHVTEPCMPINQDGMLILPFGHRFIVNQGVIIESSHGIISEIYMMSRMINYLFNVIQDKSFIKHVKKLYCISDIGNQYELYVDAGGMMNDSPQDNAKDAAQYVIHVMTNALLTVCDQNQFVSMFDSSLDMHNTTNPNTRERMHWSTP